MSLIEQLGGYEKAKRALWQEQEKGYPGDDIASALLEYRRTNNIFEVDDYVIDEQYTGLLRVTRVMKKRLDVDYLNPQVMNHVCSSSILIKHVKHATNAEIKAGYRIIS